jgi:cellulose synthase/poly-beta-1,6-N-acetylglucosamine synthase-like glycosyltransferase
MIFFVVMWNLVSISIVSVFTGGYIGLIFYYRDLFKRVKPFLAEAAAPGTKFSIIVPARNEETVIAGCIESIYKQDYPPGLFEVIVIDDHSTDNTSAIVTAYQKKYATLKLIRLQEAIEGKLLNAYKKKAIETAIPQTSGDWVLTTDADCSVTDQWLRSYDGYIRQNDPALIAGPVKFINNGSLVSIFQCLDFLSLQGVTAAVVSADKHSMCNGANLAYSKSAFIAVNGFKGIDNIASGDDMLLMHKIKKQFPGRLGYVFSPGAIVSTTPMPDWKSFLNQRIRWASKAEKYEDKSITAVLAMVYFYNVILLALGLLSFFNPFYVALLLVSLAAKIFTELSFMVPAAGFFRERKLLWWFPLMQPLHIVYIILAGWLGKFGSYQWKGRRVK